MDEDLAFTVSSFTTSIPIPEILSIAERNNFNEARGKLSKIKKLLNKVDEISEVGVVPEPLLDQYFQIKDEFERFVEKMTSNVDQSDTIVDQSDTIKAVNHYINAINSVSDYYTQFFELTSSNKRLIVCNTIINYQDSKGKLLNNQILINKLIDNLRSEIGQAKELRKELELKSSETVVSNYAKIFEEQEKSYKNASLQWFIISIVLSGVLIFFLFLSFTHNWFETTIEIDKIDKGMRTVNFVYNYPNIITKIIIISVCIYLISFSFKQYSINKNLETSNNHRKNALNSYKLFVETINHEDSNSRNALMLQVAKAIYENTSTGYLSSKHTETASNGIVELTKFVGGPKS